MGSTNADDDNQFVLLCTSLVDLIQNKTRRADLKADDCNAAVKGWFVR
jgi:hypothetical protein